MAGSRRPRRPWSLRARLVLAAISLVAVVSAVIATVTAIALSSYLYHQLDEQLRDVAMRAGGPGQTTADLDFLAKPGQPFGTLGARLDADGEVTDAAVSTEPDSNEPLPSGDRMTTLDDDQVAALNQVAGSPRPQTVEVPGLGDYRVMTLVNPRGAFLVGLPTATVDGTVRTLILVECLVAAAGLVAAGIAAASVVRMALRPLRRVAATATRVSELPLSHGEVSLPDRVPEPDTDTRTEVGQVGAALNRLLGHVGSALEARHDSEVRVRRFVADASHELRTPLASIRGYAELTRRGREDIGPDTRHALGRIESESTRMTGLVEDLLLLARLDSGRPLSMSDVDVSALLVDAFGDARAADGSAPGEAEHRWVLELPDEPVTVRADTDRLHQVLANLLANARVHTPPGTTVVGRVSRPGRAAPAGSADVAVERPTPIGQTDAGAVIVIRDDGPGIPPHLLPHVFVRFSRGDSSRSRSSGSTGLGLAIVEAVISAHDGKVSIDSEPGSTTVRVTLP